MTSKAFEFAMKRLDVFKEINMALLPMTPTKNMIQRAVQGADIDPVKAQLIYEIMVQEAMLYPTNDQE